MEIYFLCCDSLYNLYLRPFAAEIVTIQLLQWGHWGLSLDRQDERVESIVGLFAAS